MLFSFKNKYHYTYPNTHTAPHHSHAKPPATHTHTQKQETASFPVSEIFSLSRNGDQLIMAKIWGGGVWSLN